MENQKYNFNCDYEKLVGISLLSNLKVSEKITLAQNGIEYSKLEEMLGPEGSRQWDRELNWAENQDDSLDRGHIFLNSKDYPESLLGFDNPPFVLYYKGSKPKGCSGNFLNAQSLTIVGTREANTSGRRSAFLLALEAASNNIVVYSGYATGIDQAAHKGCAMHPFSTFAILPCGLEHTYAFRNSELIHTIYDADGGFISQFPLDEEPYKWNFHTRNALLAQISDATVIVQAPESSGALITVRNALDFGKDVFVHNSGSGVENCQKGTQNLINNGAISINDYKDLCIYTLKTFKGSKRVSEISYAQIDEQIKADSNHETFYRFADKWYHIVL